MIGLSEGSFFGNGLMCCECDGDYPIWRKGSSVCHVFFIAILIDSFDWEIQHDFDIITSDRMRSILEAKLKNGGERKICCLFGGEISAGKRNS